MLAVDMAGKLVEVQVGRLAPVNQVQEEVDYCRIPTSRVVQFAHLSVLLGMWS